MQQDSPTLIKTSSNPLISPCGANMLKNLLLSNISRNMDEKKNWIRDDSAEMSLWKKGTNVHVV